MRKNIKIPRILKIHSVHQQQIEVVFNNGELRGIDFKQLLKDLEVDEQHPAFILYTETELKAARLNNYSLVFENVEQYISSKTGKRIKVPFEIGADTLFKRSYPIPVPNLQIGAELKRARKKAGLSQEALAQKSGTSRTYISRIENNHSDIELATLRKIIEIGLGKTLEIKIK